METFKLWLEQDPAIPRFKRLGYAKVEVSIGDVLRKGIHPWEGDKAHPSLRDKIIDVINDGEMKFPELEGQGYCCEIMPVTSMYFGSNKDQLFVDTLNRIHESIYFVENLSFVELLALAKERLRERWNHHVAHEILSHAYPGFDNMRSFLKSKDKNIKLSGYEDVARYDLGKILHLEDFEGEDRILILEGMPFSNFRSVRFLESVTEERGLLRLVDGIRDFQMTCGSGGPQYAGCLTYNCRRDGESIRFRPDLANQHGRRHLARDFSRRWRIGEGRYCFTSDIEHLERMAREDRCPVTFPTLNYSEPKEANTSAAHLRESRVHGYRIGRFLNANDSGESIRAVLHAHKVSMTGRKEELAEKLAALSAKLYQENEPAMDRFFSERRFIRTQTLGSDARDFPLLGSLGFRNMLLTMYAIKHLRGNVILDARHNNDTFDLLSLARALLNRGVSLTGGFLEVQ